MTQGKVVRNVQCHMTGESSDRGAMCFGPFYFRVTKT